MNATPTVKALADFVAGLDAKWIVFDTIGRGAFVIPRARRVDAVKAAKKAARSKAEVTITISDKALHVRWRSPLRTGGLTLADTLAVVNDVACRVSEYRLPRTREEKSRHGKGKAHFDRLLAPSEYERVVFS